tara:strand:+ start:7144 stop:7623 length:480 start_codon:yes stop_codon:yes gene_type:complete
LDYPKIDIPDSFIPPKTIFYPPVAEIPYLDPLLLPSLEQVESGLGEDQTSSSEEEEKSSAEDIQLGQPPKVPLNLPKTKETVSSEIVATFNIPLFGEFPIPAPEIIASSVISAGVASTVAVGGSIAAQAVVAQLKKILKKIFTKVLKKEVASLKKKSED